MASAEPLGATHRNRIRLSVFGQRSRVKFCLPFLPVRGRFGQRERGSLTWLFAFRHTVTRAACGAHRLVIRDRWHIYRNGVPYVDTRKRLKGRDGRRTANELARPNVSWNKVRLGGFVQYSERDECWQWPALLHPQMKYFTSDLCLYKHSSLSLTLKVKTGKILFRTREQTSESAMLS